MGHSFFTRRSRHSHQRTDMDGNFEEMYRQIEAKMEAGYRCIKLKIGAIDFDAELTLLKHIRSRFSVKGYRVAR